LHRKLARVVSLSNKFGPLDEQKRKVVEALKNVKVRKGDSKP
jgi:hypothetical protein